MWNTWLSSIKLYGIPPKENSGALVLGNLDIVGWEAKKKIENTKLRHTDIYVGYKSIISLIKIN